MNTVHSTFCILHSAFLFVFSLGRQSAPDVPFLLVQVKNPADLHIQGIIVLLQPVGKILMYGGFGDTEVPGGCPDSGTGFNHVHSHFTSPFFQRFCHRHPSDVSVLTENPMPREMEICTLDSIEIWG